MKCYIKNKQNKNRENLFSLPFSSWFHQVVGNSAVSPGAVGSPESWMAVVGSDVLLWALVLVLSSPEVVITSWTWASTVPVRHRCVIPAILGPWTHDSFLSLNFLLSGVWSGEQVTVNHSFFVRISIFSPFSKTHYFLCVLCILPFISLQWFIKWGYILQSETLFPHRSWRQIRY